MPPKNNIHISLLIPTLNKRWESGLKVLLKHLNGQLLDMGQTWHGAEEANRGYCKLTTYKYDNFEILTLADDGRKSIGHKRQTLLHSCVGRYLAYHDDDDWCAQNYFQLLTEAIATGPDCCSLKGIITSASTGSAIFEHTIKYDKWETVTLTEREKLMPEIANGHITYLRPVNHLNLIRSDVAKMFDFPDQNSGEDFEWSEQIRLSGLLKEEAYIPEILYHYRFSNKK